MIEALQLAKQQIATGIVRRNDDESGIAEREAAKLVYGANGPYTRQPELTTISAVTLADLQAWHDRTLKGKLIVGVSGDFDPVAMEAKVRAAFEGLPPVVALPARHDEFAGPKPGVYFIDKEDVNQSNVEIVGLGTDRRNPDVPALAVMNEILGGGFGSRLFQKVRTELGLAYEVGGGFGMQYDHPALFQAEVLTKSPSTVDATKAALAEIAGLNTKPFTEEELKRAKDSILNSFLFRYDTKDKILDERELRLGLDLVGEAQHRQGYTRLGELAHRLEAALPVRKEDGMERLKQNKLLSFLKGSMRKPLKYAVSFVDEIFLIEIILITKNRI